MDLILDGNGPLYAQLVRAVRSAVAQGRLRDGARLPPSRDLARALGLSRTTVLAAYEHLRAEGLLAGRVGSGSYIRASSTPVALRPPLRREVAPQSAFGRRARQVFDPSDFFGHRPPDVRYAFQFGLPLVSPTLTSVWAREVARTAPYLNPNYPSPAGMPALREAVCNHIIRTRGVVCAPEDILIVSGTQQAIALAAKVLLDPGDDALMEEPHYFSARKILEMHGARVVAVPTDADGLCVDALPAQPAKLLYLTPSHQFPTGAVLTLERRRALLEYVARTGGWILEDDYDGEFRHDQMPQPSLQSMDRDGRVIYVGTFSKTLFPSLRVGYMIVPPGLRNDFLAAKWSVDFGSPPLEQAALAGLIASGAYERHLRYVTRKLAERRGVLLQALGDSCGDRIEPLQSHSGMHVMAWLPGLDRARGDVLVELARKRRLALYPVAPCYIHSPDRAGLLMGYGAMSAKEIRAAVAELASCLDAVHTEHRTGSRRLVLVHSA